MSFKILAIRPLADCAKNILKNLIPGEFYFFDNSYKPTDDRNGIEKQNKGHVRALPNDFFFFKSDFENSSSTLKNINILAIVGKNGSGKSSLVELLLRILNNFFKNKEYNSLTNKLRYASGVCAELYFSIKEDKKEDIIYKMTVNTSDCNYKDDVFKKGICKVEPKIDDISKQLFFTMYVNYSLYGLDSKDYLIETINEKENEHNQELEDEELKAWIGRVFHKNDGYQTQLVIHPWRKAGQIDVRNEKELMRQRLLSQIILDESFKELTDDQEIESFKFTFRGQNYLERYFHYYLNLKVNFRSDSTDVFVYELIRTIVVVNINKKNEEAIKLKKKNLWSPLKGFEDYIYLFDNQLREIAIFSLCFQALEEKIGKFSLFERSPFLENLFIYALVKLRKVLKYPRFSHVDYNYAQLNSANNKASELINGIVKVMDEGSHISIKLRQAIEILKISKQDPNNNLLTFYQKIVDGQVNEIKDIIELRKSIEDVRTKFEIEPVYLVPPQIFDVDILLVNKKEKNNYDYLKNENNRSSWKEISSGEFQKIGIMSSLIYHLSNLDSVKNDRNLNGMYYNYKNINIMLDEIELYFHPEYQRTFIYDLLSRLQKIVFKNIKSLNITFITHSPFILSDIPSQNILKMENGKSIADDTKNSFASNIHDLLKDEFFFKEGSMGKFASKKLDAIIKYLYLKSKIVELKEDLNFDFYSQKIKNDINNLLIEHMSEVSKLEKYYNEYPIEYIISLVGEPLLQRKLMEMFNKIKS